MLGGLDDIAHVIELAVAPVFLLTAISTLINAMNGRLGRVVDRRRVVVEQLRNPETEDRSEAEEEMLLLARRSRLVYLSILFAVLSALLVFLVVAGAFIGALIGADLARGVAGLFVAALLAMVASLSLFLREIYLAVRAGSHNRR